MGENINDRKRINPILLEYRKSHSQDTYLQVKRQKSQIIILSTITNMAAKKYMSKNRFANKFGESY